MRPVAILVLAHEAGLREFRWYSYRLVFVSNSDAPPRSVRCNMPALTNFPVFPQDVPTHPLLVVDYELLKAGDESEMERLWKAATELGFW